MEKNKKRLRGEVVSDKMEKTIVIEVKELKSHPIYKKKIKWSNKYMAHDEKNEIKIGDVVEIVESRPYGKNKKFCFSKLIKRS